MDKYHILIALFALACFVSVELRAQQQGENTPPQKEAYLVPLCVYKGDTIPCIQLPTLYVFKPVKFNNGREARKYNKLVNDVKKVLPIAKEVNKAIIETYEFLQTLPDEKSRQRHIKAVEKSIKEQYTPRMKKLTLTQGKLLIKLVDRQTNSTGYELVKAFLGPFRAGFYQTFAAVFGASLKKRYDPTDEDAMIERVILMIESGQL